MAGKIYPMDGETRDVLSRFHVLSDEDLNGLTPEFGYGGPGEVREVREIAKEYVEKAVRKGERLGKEDLDRLNERILRQIISDSPEGPSIGYEVEEATRGKEQLWFPFFSGYYASNNIKECANDECMGIFVPPKSYPKSKHCSSLCSQRQYYKKNVPKYTRWRRESRERARKKKESEGN